MDCAQFFSTVSEYYDKNLSSEEIELFEKHFKDCPACMTFFDGFIDTMKVIEGPCKEAYNSIEIPDFIEKRIVNFLSEKQPEA